MMKTKEFISCDVFVNTAYSSFKFQGSKEQKTGVGLLYLKDVLDVWYSLPKEITQDRNFADEEWISVVYVTPNDSHCSGWMDHCIRGYEELEGWRPRTPYLPKCIFEGKREGDCVTVNLPIVKLVQRGEENEAENGVSIKHEAVIKVQLTLAQSKYWPTNATFEQMLKRI